MTKSELWGLVRSISFCPSRWKGEWVKKAPYPEQETVLEREQADISKLQQERELGIYAEIR